MLIYKQTNCFDQYPSVVNVSYVTMNSRYWQQLIKERTMKLNPISILIGIIAGVIITSGVLVSVAPGVMITENNSKYSYTETISKINSAASAQGWKIPVSHELDKAVAKAGYNVLPVTVIELCQPKHAGEILKKDENRIVSSLMPCRVSVYETSKGDVIVSRLNSGLVSQVFGGDIATIMEKAAADTEEILLSVIDG